jgi:hypothetical protein
MTYKCPYCGESIQPSELQRPAGISGGTYCPKCWGRVYASTGYAKQLAILSAGIAFSILWFFRISAIPTLAIGTLLMAVPLWMCLYTASARSTRPTLRKWHERKYKTFYEWLHERDSPPSLTDRRPGDGRGDGS